MLVLTIAGGFAWHASRTGENTGAGEPVEKMPGLQDILTCAPEAVQGTDLAQLNLCCAQGLPGAEELDVEASLALLRAMATRAQSETERHWYRFKRDRAEFEHSEGFFRMIMLGVVLAEDFGIKCAPGKIGTAADARDGDGFFSDANDVFLSGLLGPKREGTCSSMPVLYVAVGRRLGYPLKLVATKGHLFVRPEDAKERFNIEVTGRGVDRFPDDYYRHWPLEVTEAEVAAEGYLKSLSPAEELAVFLSIRGMCLRETGRYGEAAAVFGGAARLAPGCRSYGLMWAEMNRKCGNGAGKMPSPGSEGDG